MTVRVSGQRVVSFQKSAPHRSSLEGPVEGSRIISCAVRVCGEFQATVHIDFVGEKALGQGSDCLLQLGFKVLRSPIYKTLCDPSLPGERGARQLSNFRQSSKAEIVYWEEGGSHAQATAIS